MAGGLAHLSPEPITLIGCSAFRGFRKVGRRVGKAFTILHLPFCRPDLVTGKIDTLHELLGKRLLLHEHPLFLLSYPCDNRNGK